MISMITDEQITNTIKINKDLPNIARSYTQYLYNNL